MQNLNIFLDLKLTLSVTFFSWKDKNMKRRDFLKLFSSAFILSLFQKKAFSTTLKDKTMSKPIVYFTKEISPDSLVKIYEKLSPKLEGRIGVKISTGEPGGHNYLKPELIGKLVKHLNANIVECNTAYAGRRNTLEEHLKTINGISPCLPS